VIVYDRRGCGRSERPSPYLTTSVEEQADDAAGLLAALRAAPAIVIGRSYGGEIALELARRHRKTVEALVLLDASPLHLDPEARRWRDTLKASIEHAAAHAPDRVGETLIRAALGEGSWEALPAAGRDLFTHNGPAIVAEFNGGESDLDESALATIDRPTLLVTAADSAQALRRVGQRVAAALPRCEQLEVPGGHMIDPAHPAIIAFVERTTGTDERSSAAPT